jgi:DNA polymerase-3 subunit beta
MKFEINREIFLDGIQKTLGIVEKKTTMPILNTILINAEKNKIKITATDREISLISDYEANVSEEGEIAVLAKMLYDMVREIPGEVVDFYEKSKTVKISSQRTFYKMSGYSAEEFPVVSPDDEAPLFKINGSVMKSLINKTAFAMSMNETQKNINGVFFEVSIDGVSSILKMVATDGHRLSLAKSAPLESSIRIGRGVIIPKKGLIEVRKVVDEYNEVMIGVAKNTFIVRADNVLLKVGLVDADYPDYKKVIPKEKGINLVLDRETFLHALRRMSVVSSERYGGVILSFSKGKLVLNSTNLDKGEAMEEIDVDYDGEAVDCGFNVSYLIDAISVIDTDQVIFDVGLGLKPSVVRNVDDDSYFCIIMPLKL